MGDLWSPDVQLQEEYLKNHPDVSPLTRVDEAHLHQLKNVFPSLPDEYLSFLRALGWGSLRDGVYMFYESPATLASLDMAGLYPHAENILFFGDNFAGDLGGFDPATGLVVELVHDTGKIYETGLTFRLFFRELVRG